MAKQAYIEGFFPEVKGNPARVGRGYGSTAKAAISRAIGDLLKQVNKRIQTIKATIIITERQPQESQ